MYIDERAGRIKSNVRYVFVIFILLRRISIATEGYVVKDLINVVERAIHNSEKHRSHDNTLQAGRPGRSASVDTIAPPKLCYEDFKRALETYKPTALRSIMLYKPEDVGFDNVGGLEHIKQLLIETIQWPAKVITI